MGVGSGWEVGCGKMGGHCICVFPNFVIVESFFLILILCGILFFDIFICLFLYVVFYFYF